MPFTLGVTLKRSAGQLGCKFLTLFHLALLRKPFLKNLLSGEKKIVELTWLPQGENAPQVKEEGYKRLLLSTVLRKGFTVIVTSSRAKFVFRAARVSPKKGGSPNRKKNGKGWDCETKKDEEERGLAPATDSKVRTGQTGEAP